MLTFATACSGIGAPEVAWTPLGWTALWCAEIDKAASAVLAYRFPDVPNHGDMLLLAGKIRRREIPAPDVFCAGTPCQAFSVAGLRGGLEDARGQLTITFIDIVNAMDEVRIADGKPPVIIVWENVPGVLNHAQNPLGCFLAGIAGDDDALEPGPRPERGRSSAYWTWNTVSGEHNPKWPVAGAVAGPQRTVAWRVQDAQYHGLAQRRRRVFVVASARAGFDPTGILLEFEGVRRDSPPSRETGQSVAGTLDARTDGGGFPGTDGACSGYVVPAVRGHAGVAFGGGNQRGPIDVSTALTCNERYDFDSETFIVDPPPKDYGAVAYSVALRGRDGGATAELGDEVAGCLRASGGGGDKAHVLAPVVCVTGDITHTLKADGFDASEDGTGRGQPIVPATMYSMRESGPESWTADEVSGSLRVGGDIESAAAILQPIHMAVRRLMPDECEVLQGFPPGWTRVPVGITKTGAVKWAADGPRYKQCGNSMATNCMSWIGRRIDAAVRQIDDFDDLLGDDVDALL